jgi:hypothetical protein
LSGLTHDITMPRLSNRSPLQASLVPSIDRQGRNIMVLLAKGTWSMSRENGLQPVHEAVPLAFEDTPSPTDKKGLRLCSDLCEGKPQPEALVIAPANPGQAEALQGRSLGVALGSFRFAKKAEQPWPLGPLARTHTERLQHAGTYDSAWQRQLMPLLPLDFDLRYHQAAPPDQRLPRPLAGDEPLRLAGLHQLDGLTMRLPGQAVLVTGNIRKDYFSTLAQLDTVQLWCDQPWLTLVWRLVLRPRQKIEEIGGVQVHMIRTQTARELYGLAA